MAGNGGDGVEGSAVVTAAQGLGYLAVGVRGRCRYLPIATTKAQVKIDFQTQSELKSNLFSSPFRTAGVGLSKTDAQYTYGFRFGRHMNGKG
ncbi:hypothetical protein U9M48_004523 [Paspalum notatum var. saurae]|uniref:Uncharacterized protein n=1 Tax=Paspalum notatum var. saurae TaxID=547442 RepID=A0AAQ3PK29_PASNO